MKTKLTSFLLAICLLFTTQSTSFAGRKTGHNRILAINLEASTIDVTNMSLGKQITLKVDKLITEITIDNKKATLADLHKGMEVAYNIGVNDVAARIKVETPAAKSVFRH